MIKAGSGLAEGYVPLWHSNNFYSILLTTNFLSLTKSFKQ